MRLIVCIDLFLDLAWCANYIEQHVDLRSSRYTTSKEKVGIKKYTILNKVVKKNKNVKVFEDSFIPLKQLPKPQYILESDLK